MKVKVMKFRVSNASSSVFKDDKNDSWYLKSKQEVATPVQIETTVNAFLSTVEEVVSICVNTVDVHYHNNGRGNEVDLIYSIVYKESAPECTLQQLN